MIFERNSLLLDFLKYDSIISNYDGGNYLDTSMYSFLAPTTLIPLLNFIDEKNITLKNHPRTRKYVDNIINRKTINTNTEYKVLLPKTMEERQDLAIVENMVNNINSDYNSYIIKHTLNEMINNIYEHSPFGENSTKKAYIYAQEYPNPGKLDICIRDDGLSIGGNFRLKGVNIDDCEALFKATSKNSTSEEKEEKDKGNGLWTTIRLVVEGNGGNILIVSGKSYLYIESRKKYTYGKLTENYFKGAMISVRLFKRDFLMHLYGEDSLLEPNRIPRYEIKFVKV